jgi:peptidoglycan/xylan/chitin deacetylase (PgdA/CDA1 family)
MKYLITLSIFFLLETAQAKNIKAEVQATLLAHKSTNTYLNWESSPHHPHNLIESIIQIIDPKRKELVTSEFCYELSLLKSEDLSVFYNEISHWNYRTPIQCLENLLFKTDFYYRTLGALLKQKSLLKTNLPQDENTKKSFGPSRIEFLDTSTGSIINYGDRGNLSSNELAFTFDDGPHPRLTLELLSQLGEENITATFFAVGKNLNLYPEIARKVVEYGHTLGTHSYSHKNLPKENWQEGVDEINKGFESALLNVSSVAPFFRFPFGSKNQSLVDFVKEQKLTSFFWDVDTLDWKKTNPEELLLYTLEQISKIKYGVVLFHDIQPQTIAIIPSLFIELKLLGYKPVVYKPTKWLIDYNKSEPNSEANHSNHTFN